MTETILPHEMPNALDRADGAKILSLDCFDTLLWRDCHAPSDVFSAFPNITVRQRGAGETNARKAEVTQRGRSEVSLEQIYAQIMPNGDIASRSAGIADEVSAEARSCFAFAPTVELMARAKERGLKVIIVSDTYLDERQLLELILKAAGDEVAGLIDKVFASSTNGVSKSQGLLARVLKAMKCKPSDILHIGDNKAADHDAARVLGIPALHLVQFSETARQRLRFERTCQQLAGDAPRDVRGLQLHRALLALAEPGLDDLAERLGFTVLGPVFHAYERWLRKEAAVIEQERGGTVHWLFMLRDGHLPFIVHEVGGAVEGAAGVEISRSAAIAASLTSNEAIDDHIALEHGLNPSTLARQMLFTEEELDPYLVDQSASDVSEQMAEKAKALLTEVRSGRRKKLIKRRSREFAERLVAHVRAKVDPAPGDTLMLVDLGYNGSAQNHIDKLLCETFDVHVAGRYLLLREMTASGFDKKGLIDRRHFDCELLEAICANVAVLEQLATTALGSVVDYNEEGMPIRTRSAVKGRQSTVREKVQQGCVDFCRRALSPPIVRTSDHHAERGWRDCAHSVLMRFMFLPQSDELEVVKNFEHDVNMGSDRMVALFDADHARDGMRRRGLFYMNGTNRMYLPAELASEDMNTRLSLLAQTRFGLGLSYTDQVSHSLEIPAIYINETDSAQGRIAAVPTHDGYYVARIPIGESGYSVALQFGHVCAWIELAEITRAPLSALKGETISDNASQPLSGQFDQMAERGPGIFECESETSLVLVSPPPGQRREPEMIEVVFRPLVLRNQANQVQAHLLQVA